MAPCRVIVEYSRTAKESPMAGRIVPDTEVVFLMSSKEKILRFSVRPPQALREIGVKVLVVASSLNGNYQT